MIPILYPADETAFSSNGLGMLSDAISCSVQEEINGKFELGLKYPVNGLRYSGIDYRSIIMAQPAPGKDPQPFRVYRIAPSSAGTVAVYARHIAYDLMGIPVQWVAADSCSEAVAALKEAAVVDCPFVFYTDVTSSAAFQIGLPRPLWRCLAGMEGSMLDTYGGEFEFDRWTVKHLTRRGADRGVTIRYGKNLSTLEQDKNCAEVYTGVLPFWSDVDRTQVLAQSPPIRKLDGDFDYDNIFILDLSGYFSEPPSFEDFNAKVDSYISANNLGKPKVSWKISFVPLSKTQEYAHLADLEEVYLGDTVTVYFPAMDVDVSARVAATEYDVLAGHYTSVTLGSVRDNLARTIARQGAQIATKPSVGLTKAIATQVSSGL